MWRFVLCVNGVKGYSIRSINYECILQADEAAEKAVAMFPDVTGYRIERYIENIGWCIDQSMEEETNEGA